MKLTPLINQLVRVLPTLTDYFTSKVTVTLSFSGGTVTATSPSAHGLQTGDYTNITGANFPTVISSITRVGNVGTAITSVDHDLTDGYHATVNITGADQSEYNGDKVLLGVKNRREFTFTVTGDPATPATGTLFLNEDRPGYNGRHQVTRVSDTVFTYLIAQTPGGDSSGESKSKARISGGVTYDRLRDAYTKQETTDSWCFVVPQPTRIGRNQGMKEDAINHIAPNIKTRIQELEEFTIYLFIPARDISGIQAYDQAQTIVPFVYSSMLGFMPPTDLTQDRFSGATITGHGFQDYNGAVFIYYMDFQMTRVIGNSDTFIDDQSVAFRDFKLTTLNDFDEPLTVAQIDLDKEPLP